MSDKKIYVDPNSGAAPQPGGYAGVEAAKKGFAAEGIEVDEEVAPAYYEPPGGNPEPKSVEEQASLAEERSSQKESDDAEYREQLRQSLSNPKKVLADLDESGNAVAPEEGVEQQASLDASVEHQGVDPSQPEDGGAEAYDPSQHNADEVNAYLEENPDQRDAVLAAERKGKKRKSVLGE